MEPNESKSTLRPAIQSRKKELQMSSANQSLWLVKVPNAVAEKWTSGNAGDSLGTLNITSVIPNPGAKPVHQISVNLSNVSTLNPDKITMTNEYTLDEIPTSSQMMGFGYDSKEDKYFVKGKVSKLYALRPKGMAYRQVIRNRNEASQTKKELQKVTASQINQNSTSALEVDFIPPAYVDAKRKAESESSSSKRPSRASEGIEDVRRKVIEAFSRKEQLTLKELLSYTQSSQTDVKELLKTYAKFHSKGPLKNFYELKPEYKTSTSSSSSINR
jgi:hypothetical protein